ncbi:MAG: helix-turn-helix domain-containing protein, partial [Firmicutes bacterium]|nr:helix-turn-helix domain-containing protein [Bacillota bacterium]
RRMTTACELLKAGSISISVIAEKLRYQSIHSFSKAFKKNYGISPAQYRCFKLGKHQE